MRDARRLPGLAVGAGERTVPPVRRLAGHRAIALLVASSGPIKLPAGTQVFGEASGFCSGLWRIRPAALPVTSWMLRKTVECH
jgi:hypothetical protein